MGTSKNENSCHHCNTNGHWIHTYRTAKHFIDLYQVSTKEKQKGVEINFAKFYDDFANDTIDSTQFDMSNFWDDPQENNNFVEDKNI